MSDPSKKPKVIFDKITMLGLIFLVFIAVGLITVLHPKSSNDTNKSSQNDKASSIPSPTVSDSPSQSISNSPTKIEPTIDWVESADEDKAAMQKVTIADLTKQPNYYKDKHVTFTGTIGNFLQDDSGNTNGMNMDDPNVPGSVVYVSLDPTMPLSQVNKGDNVTIWGVVTGVQSGTNAFGAVIEEPEVLEIYLTDNTTGYVYDALVSPTP